MDSIVVGGNSGVMTVTLNKAYENCRIALQKYTLTNYAFYNHEDTEDFYIQIGGVLFTFTLNFPANITQSTLCNTVNSIVYAAAGPSMNLTYSGTEYTISVTGVSLQNVANINIYIGPIFNRYLNGIIFDYVLPAGVPAGWGRATLRPALFAYADPAPYVPTTVKTDIIGWATNYIGNATDRNYMVFRGYNTSQNFLNEPVIGLRVNAPLELYNSQYIDIIMPKSSDITIAEENTNLFWITCNYLPINLRFTLVYLTASDDGRIIEIPFKPKTYSTITILIKDQSKSRS